MRQELFSFCILTHRRYLRFLADGDTSSLFITSGFVSAAVRSFKEFERGCFYRGGYRSGLNLLESQASD